MTPEVIWMARTREVFRLVDGGPSRLGKPHEPRFTVEMGRGRDAMGAKTWGGVPLDARLHAIDAMANAFGLVLQAWPTGLAQNHPIGCELNMAVIERRPTRGCDCFSPADRAKDNKVQGENKGESE